MEQLEPRMLLTGELMEYRLQLFQAGTNTPLASTIQRGTDFDLAVMVQDLRGPGSSTLIGDRGVFSGFLDVLFNKSLAGVEIEEVQRINIVGSPSGGNFTLTFNDGTVSRTTTSITYNPGATPVQIATAIQNALAALSNIGAGNVEVLPVSNFSTTSFRVRFQGKLGDKNLPLMTSDEPGVVQINQTDAIDGGTPTPANFLAALRRYRIVSGQLEEYYTNQQLGSDQTSPDRIDDAGGVVNVFNFPDPEDSQKLLFRVRMNTLNAGVLSFLGSVADIGLGSETTLFGSGGGADDPLLASQIRVVNPTSITITEPFSANADAFIVNEDAAATTLNVTLNDRKNNPDAVLPTGIVIVSVTQGSLGGIVSINTGAKTVNYTPAANAFGTETFTYTLRDPTTLVTDTATVTITINAVNDSPVNTVPGIQSVPEDGTRTFSSGNSNLIAIADIDAGGNNVQTSLTVASGKLTLSGTTGLAFISGANGSASMMIQGTIGSINAALAGMQYAPNLNFSGSDTLQILTSDLGHTGSPGAKSDTDTVTINVLAVNDAPEVSVPAAQLATELIPLTLPAITISDVDVTGTNLQVTLSVTGSGKLQLASITGLTFVSGANNTNSMSFKGTPASINAALAAVVYTAAPGDDGSQTLTVLAADNGSTGSGGPRTDQETVQIDVSPLERPYAVDDAFTFGRFIGQPDVHPHERHRRRLEHQGPGGLHATHARDGYGQWRRHAELYAQWRFLRDRHVHLPDEPDAGRQASGSTGRRSDGHGDHYRDEYGRRCRRRRRFSIHERRHGDRHLRDGQRRGCGPGGPARFANAHIGHAHGSDRHAAGARHRDRQCQWHGPLHAGAELQRARQLQLPPQRRDAEFQ
jgi:hypothetical protein